MAWNKEKDLKLKYECVDGENDSPHRKRRKKTSPKKANHRHEYKNIVIDFRYPNDYPISRLAGTVGHTIESYCTVCGKVSGGKIDPAAKELFPHVGYGHFGYSIAIAGYEKETQEYRAWANEHYPHYMLTDYWDGCLNKSMILDLNHIISPKSQEK